MKLLDCLVLCLKLARDEKNGNAEAIISSLIGAIKVGDERGFLTAIVPWTIKHISEMSGASEIELRQAYQSGDWEKFAAKAREAAK